MSHYDSVLESRKSKFLVLFGRFQNFQKERSKSNLTNFQSNLTISYLERGRIGQLKRLIARRRIRNIVATYENYNEEDQVLEYLRTLGHNFILRTESIFLSGVQVGILRKTAQITISGKNNPQEKNNLGRVTLRKITHQEFQVLGKSSYEKLRQENKPLGKTAIGIKGLGKVVGNVGTQF